jgi:hypothetical protein
VATPLRWRRRLAAPALALAAALAVAGCAAATAGTSADAPASDAQAITAAQASQAFGHYVSTTAKAIKASDGALALSVVTGVQQAIVSAELTMAGPHSASGDSAAYSGSLGLAPASYSYGTPTFYLPEPAGYPRFFVADVTRTLRGTNPADGASGWLGGASVPFDGRVLMVFEQSGASAPWLLASISQLPAGTAVPALATDKNGYVPQVPLTSAGLLAQPYATGPLQAAVVDDGPSSAASKAVAAGPLTTTLYQSARTRADTGLQVPAGDVYQWDMEGTPYPAFALRTANGGALVLYAMYLNSTIATPSYINKGDPIVPGLAIEVPLVLSLLLPANQPAPRVSLEAQDLLSFAAVDPPSSGPSSPAKIQVIAIGGGLNYAAAS